jgi:hypothetical protein
VTAGKTVLGSISECLLLAKNPLKLPGRFWCRASALLMTDDGRIPERQLKH